MGNWHCIPSSCAEVHYREYLPPVVRWRYEGEDWHEIEADDYSFETVKNWCPEVLYRLYYSKGFFTPQGISWQAPGTYYVDMPTSVAYQVPYSNIKMVAGAQGTYYYDGINPIFHWSYQGSGINPNGSRTRSYAVYLDTPTSQNNLILLTSGNGVRLDSFVPLNSPSCIDTYCKFTVYQNGVIVHSEQRENCPEVEKIDCKLSEENKVIKVEKLPWLERVEVVDYQIHKLLLNVFRAQIPDECLNIYRNDITGIIPLPVGFPLPYTYTSWEWVAQICSVPGCPPPEYQVICNCDCESCPDGTCAVECEGQICCYDSDGIAVQQIAIEDYCEV